MRLFHHLSMALILTGLMSLAQAASVTTTLDFEAIEDYYNANLDWRDNYGGFKWTHFGSQQISYSDKGGYQWGATSGDYMAYNSNARDVSVELVDGGVFDFNSAYMTAAWNDDLNVTVEGWLDGNLTFSQTVVLSTMNPLFFEFEFTNIDKLTFSSFGGTPNPLWDYKDGGHGTHFAIDDMTFTTTVAVPEPSTYAMMLSGMALVGFVAYRRRSQLLKKISV